MSGPASTKIFNVDEPTGKEYVFYSNVDDFVAGIDHIFFCSGIQLLKPPPRKLV